MFLSEFGLQVFLYFARMLIIYDYVNNFSIRSLNYSALQVKFPNYILAN